MTTTFNVSCCFCNQTVEPINGDPCDLNIQNYWNGPEELQQNQTFFCHLECFREMLNEPARSHLIIENIPMD